MSKSATKILETAEKLFNQQSFVGVGVDLIRDESGCSKTTMYTYYKNKDQLIQSVLNNRDERFRRSLLDAVSGKQGWDAISHIYDWHMQWFQTDTFKGCLFVRAVAESNLVNTDIILIAQNHKAWLKQMIYQHCEEAAIAQYFELIYTLFEGLISRFLVDGFDLNVAQEIKKNIEVFFNR